MGDVGQSAVSGRRPAPALAVTRSRSVCTLSSFCCGKVGWGERSESHHEDLRQEMVGLADQAALGARLPTLRLPLVLSATETF